jgi:UDP-glucose 4-epimerase
LSAKTKTKDGVTLTGGLTEDAVRDAISNKRILVTGGTGSFGHTIVDALLRYEPERVVILSRDETKQYFMRDEYRGDSRLEFVIGDVRDYETVRAATDGAHIVYHAAALKQVPSCELHPVEAIRTNSLGAENVRRAALDCGVEAVVAVSTDKAVKPVNAMGMSKALMEKIILNAQGARAGTRLMCVRYGNVVASRGSVVPLFKERILANRPLPITVPYMTRFLLTLPQAVELVLWTTVVGHTGTLYVSKMPACTVAMLARTLGQLLRNDPDYPTETVGIRPGEKIHEILVSEDEMHRAVETESHYAIGPATGAPAARLLRDLPEYRSDNAEQLDARGLERLLRAAGTVD